MTKPEARKLALSIIDYFVALAGDLKRSNIDLCISDNDMADEDSEAETRIDTTHRLSSILLNITPDTQEDYIIRAVCHELAHIFTQEFRHFYRVFVAEPDEDEGAISRAIFTNADEAIAYRLQDIFFELWITRKHK